MLNLLSVNNVYTLLFGQIKVELKVLIKQVGKKLLQFIFLVLIFKKGYILNKGFFSDLWWISFFYNITINVYLALKFES